ncbi:MAG: FdtA/QdtA family cupin domain-containing protein [Bacteroidaceae bacterium]|nr:FdtA/QdtA family cupin domain-containing protein [Bacteroidaceae bacterium]
MDKVGSIALAADCQLIRIPSVSDERGCLSVVEDGGQAVPFAVRRVFWIYDVPGTSCRGSHAHRTCSEVVFPVTGGFTMLIDNGRERDVVRLDKANEGIYIPAGVWCELRDFDPGTALVCLASEPYDAAGYIHDYNQYLKEKLP